MMLDMKMIIVKKKVKNAEQRDLHMPENFSVSESVKKITVLAAAFSGNKGAASMLESIIENISVRVPGISFDVLSVYPEDDKVQNPYKHVNIVACKPEQIIFAAFPLSLLHIALSRIKPIEKLLLKNPILASLSGCDLVVDAAGISFVDSRGIIMNLYNFICIFIPVALRKEVIKFSQAMGPFRKLSNRLLAGAILPRVKTICARGLITESHLKGLQLGNTILSTDGAFVLPDDRDTVQKMALVFSSDPFYKEKIAGVSISSVVYGYCIKEGIDYVAIMSRMIDHLAAAKGYNILIIAHSARENKESLKNNDLVICRKVYNSVECKEKCRYPDMEMSPREIREYIGRCDMLIASRFHAMISALYKNVPVFLIGWGHKYKEVLDMFGHGGYAVDYRSLNLDLLKNKFELFEKDINSLRWKISENIEEVKKSAMKNIDVIVDSLNSR